MNEQRTEENLFDKVRKEINEQEKSQLSKVEREAELIERFNKDGKHIAERFGQIQGGDQ